MLKSQDNYPSNGSGLSGVMTVDYYVHENLLGHITTRSFPQPDPIGFDAGDVNWYRYVGNNAVNYTDPNGFIRIPWTSLFTPKNPAKDAKPFEVCRLEYEEKHELYGCPEKFCVYSCYEVFYDYITDRYQKTINIDADKPCPKNGR
ncbi:MAG: hypothetical protein NZM04_01795 [Methylacidiphilales bacterium]|nr:hypothetical protein [Candidatus Methylacidiphilales bacterium]